MFKTLWVASCVVGLLLSVAQGATAAPFPCNCFAGSIAATQPQCECSCPSDYIDPNCLYTAVSTVRVELWFNYSIAFFSDLDFRTGLDAGLQSRGVYSNTTFATFILSQGSPNNKTMALYDMDGASVWELMLATWGRLPWAVNLGLIQVYDKGRVSAPSSSLDQFLQSVVIYSAPQGQYVITADDLCWALGALVTGLGALLIELSCSGDKNESAVPTQTCLAQLRREKVATPVTTLNVQSTLPEDNFAALKAEDAGDLPSKPKEPAAVPLRRSPWATVGKSTKRGV